MIGFGPNRRMMVGMSISTHEVTNSVFGKPFLEGSDTIARSIWQLPYGFAYPRTAFDGTIKGLKRASRSQYGCNVENSGGYKNVHVQTGHFVFSRQAYVSGKAARSARACYEYWNGQDKTRGHFPSIHSYKTCCFTVTKRAFVRWTRGDRSERHVSERRQYIHTHVQPCCSPRTHVRKYKYKCK